VSTIRVASLHVFPLKAAAGVTTLEAEVTRRGLAGDRLWMVVDERGDFLSQRELPKLCLLRAQPLGDRIELSFPGAGSSSLPRSLDEGPRVTVNLWRFTGPAIVHEAASAWASRALDVACRIVFLPADAERTVDPGFARPGDVVSFADGFPLLFASTSSLADLNARLATPVPMLRFRPNLVVEGAPPFAEDRWRRVRLGGLEWHLPKLCGRCRVVTVDPATGETSPEPLRTLATFRRRGRDVCFGVNAIPEGRGRLRVGDVLEVLEEGDPPRAKGERG
jgi:uncharacterized protein